jgi:hypothetical protein
LGKYFICCKLPGIVEKIANFLGQTNQCQDFERKVRKRKEKREKRKEKREKRKEKER